MERCDPTPRRPVRLTGPLEIEGSEPVLSRDFAAALARLIEQTVPRAS